MKRLLMGLVLLTLLSGQVRAVPTLQLFSPDAHYDVQSSYWVSIDESFELWVVGAQSPEWVHEVSDVSLLVAVPAAYWDPAAEIYIEPITSSRAVDADANPVSSLSFSFPLTAANLTSVDGDGIRLRLRQMHWASSATSRTTASTPPTSGRSRCLT